MAHFAQLDADNVVLDVIVINNAVIKDLPFPESEPLGVAFCQSLYGADTVWKQTSYSANFRGAYAGIGYTYDATRDAFIAPKPEEGTWVLNENTCQWERPVEMPKDGKTYNWDEATQSWIAYVPPQA